MAPASNEEQFKFLISCIRWSNNGKVDFGQVAGECNIVSKGAAAKRYERMMKAHGIAPNAAAAKPTTPSRTPKSERRQSVNAGLQSKKRKAEAFEDEHANEDDVEDFGDQGYGIKADPEHGNIKEETKNFTFEDAIALSPSQYVPQPTLEGSEESNFLSGAFSESSPFSQDGRFQTPEDGGFGMTSQKLFGDFGNYGTPEVAQPNTPLNQLSDYQPIVIGD